MGISSDDITFEQLLTFYQNLKDFAPLKGISKLDPEYRDKFIKLYKFCDCINGKTEYKGLSQAKTTRKKGQALELLLKSMFVHTGNIFETYENLGTGTNEIDLYLRVTGGAKILLGNVIDSRFKNIICECKNHQKPIDVTYIGKFYSLVSVSHINIAIMVSWHGIGGEGWNDGAGLVKKIYMLHEKKDEKIYILDFNKSDFEKIINGEELLEVLEKKCEELEMDITFNKYFEKHPNQDEFEEKIDNILKST